MYILLGIFKDRTDPDAIVDQLAAKEIGRDAIGVVWREKIVHKEEDIEVITYVDHFDGPAVEAKKGALGGVIGGAAFGAASAILAATGIILGPEVATMLGTGTAAAAAAAAAAGAAGGGITGGAIGALLGATDHDATKVTKHELERHDVTERDGFVITVETEEASMPWVAEILTDLGATNVTALGGDGSKLRTPLE